MHHSRAQPHQALQRRVKAEQGYTSGLRLVMLGLAIAVFAALAGIARAEPHVVFDAETMEVFASETPHQRWAPASLTKIMTAYVALKAVKSGHVTLKSPVFISVRALDNPPSKMNFPYGTILRLDEALAIIMVKSANDVAHAIGEAVAGSLDGFVDQMNETAKVLGMENSHFANASGLPDPDHYSTAHDLAVLSAAAFRDFPDYAYLFRIGAVRYKQYKISNHNRLLVNFLGADGLKTGFVCASGLNLAASATRNGRHMIAIVLGQPSSKTRNAITARHLGRAFKKARAAGKNGKFPKLDQMPKMIWWNPKPGDISRAICVKGGRNRWKKGLKEYVKLLEEHYYSPNPAGPDITIRPGGATGPNPYDFPIEDGHRAPNLIGRPTPRPPLECYGQYARVLGVKLALPTADKKEMAGTNGQADGQEAISHVWLSTPAFGDEELVAVNKGDRVVKFAARAAGKAEGQAESKTAAGDNCVEQPDTAQTGQTAQPAASNSAGEEEAETEESALFDGSANSSSPEVAEGEGEAAALGSTVTSDASSSSVPVGVPQKAPERIIDEDLPFLDRNDKTKRTACIPYPFWRNGGDERTKPFFDPQAEQRKIERQIQNGELVDM